MARLGIIAGQGRLPVALKQAVPEAHLCAFEGVGYAGEEHAQMHRFDALGRLMAELHEEGVTELVLAGAMRRPALDAARLDPLTLSLMPRLQAALRKGDDGLLRDVVQIFEEQGFHVIGAHQVDTDLTASEGVLTVAAPSASTRGDIARAASILAALSRVDVGQAAVVEGGLCLGVESVQGTDALLRFVAASPPELRRGQGVLLKAPKAGQDLRVDMPSIGPGTVARAVEAGLSGIAIEAGLVLILDRAATLAAADEAGLFLEAVNL